MEILAFDDRVEINNVATSYKKSFSLNDYKISFQNDYLRIIEAGTGNLNIQIKNISEVTSITDSRTGGAGVITVPATLSLLYDVIFPFFFAEFTDTQPISLIKSSKKKLLDEADDLVKTFSYLDAGLSDERVSTIVYSSVLLSLSVTDTFAYAGSSPNFRISTITLS